MVTQRQDAFEAPPVVAHLPLEAHKKPVTNCFSKPLDLQRPSKQITITISDSRVCDDCCKRHIAIDFGIRSVR